MAASQSVQTCRWGVPTLLLPWPLWCDTAKAEWSCTADPAPWLLADPAVCRTCARWAPFERVAAAAPQPGCHYQRALVMHEREGALEWPAIT
jgi:hypothetical protein